MQTEVNGSLDEHKNLTKQTNVKNSPRSSWR